MACDLALEPAISGRRGLESVLALVSSIVLFTICFSTRTMMKGLCPGLRTCNVGRGLLCMSGSPRILKVEVLLPLNKLCYRCETTLAVADET